jgi:hypothetical protein
MAHSVALYTGSWQGDPKGLVATSRPLTVALRLSQADSDGQQVSPGKQRHEADSEAVQVDAAIAQA